VIEDDIRAFLAGFQDDFDAMAATALTLAADIEAGRVPNPIWTKPLPAFIDDWIIPPRRGYHVRAEAIGTMLGQWSRSPTDEQLAEHQLLVRSCLEELPAWLTEWAQWQEGPLAGTLGDSVVRQLARSGAQTLAGCQWLDVEIGNVRRQRRRAAA
jgi:hypothetical protein